MIKRFVVGAIVLAGLAVAALSVEARQCQTTCNRYGNQTVCNQNCW